MENVTDALHIAFGVLAFVIALSISIWAFGNVRIASEGILKSIDREEEYTYMDYTGENAIREVTVVDIVPTLYRAYKENYIVKFEGLEKYDGRKYLFAVKKSNDSVDTSTIDLEGQSIRNHDDAAKFITALLRGNTNGEFMSLLGTGNYTFIDKTKGYLQNKPFYDILKESIFKESLGIFYQEDRKTDEQKESSSVEDVNKTKKRIVTYTFDRKK